MSDKDQFTLTITIHPSPAIIRTSLYKSSMINCIAESLNELSEIYKRYISDGFVFDIEEVTD